MPSGHADCFRRVARSAAIDRIYYGDQTKMVQKASIKPLAFALGTAFVTALPATAVVNAADNPFAMTELSSGYMVADAAEGKCGEGKCGGSKAGAKSDAEGKCGAGADGHKAGKEGKCGEGKCGASKDGDKAGKEGKCGEGKCGGAK